MEREEDEETLKQEGRLGLGGLPAQLMFLHEVSEGRDGGTCDAREEGRVIT